MIQVTDEKPKFLGKTEIPNDYRKRENKAQMCRELLEGLTNGQADLYEFGSKKEAEDYRSMLYSMAILKYGSAGRIATRLIENLLYVWLSDGESNE